MENLVKLELFKFSWISGFSNTSHQHWCVEVTLEYLLHSVFVLKRVFQLCAKPEMQPCSFACCLQSLAVQLASLQGTGVQAVGSICAGSQGGRRSHCSNEETAPLVSSTYFLFFVWWVVFWVWVGFFFAYARPFSVLVNMIQLGV